MEEDIRLWFEPEPDPIRGQGRLPKDFETVKETSKEHGRLEERTLTVSSRMNDFLDWPYVQQVFRLERRFVSTKTGEIQEKLVYGLTSLSREEITSVNLLKKIRSYWGIENGLHYRRDVTLREDRTRMTKGRSGRIMACLNNLVIGLLLPKPNFLISRTSDVSSMPTPSMLSLSFLDFKKAVRYEFILIATNCHRWHNDHQC